MPISLRSLVRQCQWIFLRSFLWSAAGREPKHIEMILVKWDPTWSCWSLTLLGFNPFSFDLLSRKCHAENQKARLMQDFELYFGSVSSRTWKFCNKIALKRLRKLFLQAFCPNNPWTAHVITSSTQYDHCSRFVNQTRACDQLSGQAHSFPKAHELFHNLWTRATVFAMPETSLAFNYWLFTRCKLHSSNQQLQIALTSFMIPKLVYHTVLL